MVFYSKFDRWLMVMNIIVLLAAALGIGVSLLAIQEALWLRLVVVVVLLLAMYFCFRVFTLRYIVQDDTLSIMFLYEEKINIYSITSIRATNDIISSPAMSTDRIEISFGEKKSILLSPKDKKAFIDALVAINQHIEVDVNLSYMKRGKDDGVPSET
ncbi:PH domain-containing protein [Priestia taiwanensis]|uniref:Uncharacterized protein YyaB-like PH domain-containing protein n=1 Tax=Priestia taiwanensis TaxID=1347902 RepID=A0A917AU27_9BACI|nr:PH domain-containing protein [Priestia taiwanensis]MBM7363950.1 hypothetical protein [Priestia taiwanensis]GGE70421.1 hypothetical protein GCM10007140_20410 [Priestia taiwanensis]